MATQILNVCVETSRQPPSQRARVAIIQETALRSNTLDAIDKQEPTYVCATSRHEQNWVGPLKTQTQQTRDSLGSVPKRNAGAEVVVTDISAVSCAGVCGKDHTECKRKMRSNLPHVANRRMVQSNPICVHRLHPPSQIVICDIWVNKPKPVITCPSIRSHTDRRKWARHCHPYFHHTRPYTKSEMTHSEGEFRAGRPVHDRVLSLVVVARSTFCATRAHLGLLAFITERQGTLDKSTSCKFKIRTQTHTHRLTLNRNKEWRSCEPPV